mmetsp:Transcript_18181/g.31099  ORF Transcript_18181/g.31099 Transcript_18181/m.31099 type:complete len:372 (+) Transcript_18181:58-1173(+)
MDKGRSAGSDSLDLDVEGAGVGKAVALSILVQVSNYFLGGQEHGVVVLGVAEAVVEDQVSARDHAPVERHMGNGLLDEAIELLDRLESESGLQVVLGEGVADLAEPGLAADQLVVDAVVGHDVHVVPPSVVEVVPPLVVHPHFDQAASRQVQRIGLAHHHPIVDEPIVGGGHSIHVLVVLLRHDQKPSVPLMLLQILLHELLALRSLLETEDGDKVLQGQGLGGERSGRRVLEQEFLDSLPQVLHAEDNLVLLVSGGHEDRVGILSNLVLRSEICSNLFDGLLHVSCEILLTCEQVVLLDEATEHLGGVVDVLDGVIDSVLADVLGGEDEAIVVSGVEGHSVVAVVELGEGELLEVSHEPGVQVSLGHLEG